VSELRINSLFTQSEKMIKSSSISITNLHCANCVRKIEKRISNIKGVLKLHLSFATGQLNVSYDPQVVSITELKKRVEELGHNIFESEMAQKSVLSIGNLKLVFIIISGIALFSGLVFMFFLPAYQFILFNINIQISKIFFLVAMVFGGYYITREAISELLEKNFAIESLMLLAAIGAVLIDAFAEAAAILFLFSIAELLESYATERSRRSINELIKITPKTVNVKSGQRTVKVPVERVKVGDTVVVKSGSYIGVDGVILKGSSAVNQAPITGEAMPVYKKPGDVVYTGTLNHDGRLEVKVTQPARDTTLAKIIKLIETAEENESTTERFMDRFAKYYTPSVLILAVLVILVPVVLFQQSFEVWFYKALMLILISCPCALAISTPVSIVSAITHGAKKGVLFKGGKYVEKAASVDTIAFDKTGTLTTGKPVVKDIIPLKGHAKDELLHIAASLECLCKHPLGDALVEFADQNGVLNECVERFQTIPGKGVYGTINGKKYFVGTKSLFKKSALQGLEKYFAKFSSQAKSVVLIGTEEEIIGIITFTDELRENSKQMVKDLRKAGVARLVMLTGDNTRTAQAIAKQVGIDEYHAELLPEEKLKFIGKLNNENGQGKVAMLGDGINDSPALTAADLGIAMGTAGTDTVLEAADIALMNDDLSKVPYLLRLSRKTMSVVKQNIILAVGIKLVFAILVFPGLVTLWMAVAIGDMGVSLGVILNALRVGNVK